MALENALLIADVSHQRLFPRKHSLQYRVYYLCFALSKISELANRFLSVNKTNVFSFHDKDHGFGNKPCMEWAREVLDAHNIKNCDGEIVLLTMPRLLGYVFNPVSFWFCLSQSGAVQAVIAEVNNTFGQRHAYLCAHDNGHAISADEWLTSDKVFHVSPFLEVKGQYHFRFSYSEHKIGVWINYYDNEKLVLTTSLAGKRKRLSSRSLMSCFVIYPMMTFQIIAFIHWHAIRMMLKKFRYHNKPPLTAPEVTR